MTTLAILAIPIDYQAAIHLSITNIVSPDYGPEWNVKRAGAGKKMGEGEKGRGWRGANRPHPRPLSRVRARGEGEYGELVKDLRAVWLEFRPGTMDPWSAAFGVRRLAVAFQNTTRLS